MQDIAAELITALKVLRKGRGVDDHDLRQRLGSTLSMVLGIEADTPASDIRTAVRDWLIGLAEQLPADLKLSVLAAFGLHQDARHRFYRDRMEWLAGELKRDARTAQRRVDEAGVQLAGLAAEAYRDREIRALPAEATPWHTHRLTTTVVLDGGAPEIFEWRRIVCHQAGLTAIDHAVTITASPSAPEGTAAESTDLGIDVLSGGRLVRTVMESSRRIGFALALPKPLAEGEQAEFVLRFRIPASKAVRPHFVCVPKYRCDRFDLRVRFDLDRPPLEVWRLTSAFQNDIDDPIEVGEAIAVDAAGEVQVRFDDLKPGFAYGARWAPNGPAAGGAAGHRPVQ
jgi:hypothetical protein